MKHNKINISFWMLISCMMVHVNVLSQQANTDSLENVLTNTTDPKEKLEIYCTLARALSASNFDKSTKYAKDAQRLAAGLKYKAKEAEALMYEADAYSYANNFKESNNFYLSAIAIFNKTGNNESKALALNSIGLNFYLGAAPDSALTYYVKALELSKQFDIDKELGNASFYMGQVYRKKGNKQKAVDYYNNATKAFEKVKDFSGLAKVYNSLGLIQAESGSNNEAIFFYQKALTYREQTNDKKGCAILYNNIGNILLKWGKYENAISEYQKALRIFESINNQEGIARCSNNIGLVYENITRGEQYKQNLMYYTKALEFHNKALSIWEKLAATLEIATSLNNIANVTARLAYTRIAEKYGSNWENNEIKKNLTFIAKEYRQAIAYYQQSLALREGLKDTYGIAESLTNLGKIYISTGNYTNALAYLKKALLLNEKLENKYEIACTLYEISLLYYTTSNHVTAIEYLNRSLEIANTNQLKSISKDIYLLLSNIYQAQGELKMSLAAYKQFVSIQDSILNESNLKQIAEIQTLYETEKKEQQIQLLNKDANLKDIQIKQKNATIYFFIIGMALILVISVLLIKQNKDRKKANLELENKNQLITWQKQEITDSIHYARRIQNAVMPFESYIKQLLPQSFIYFKPRDIVSGDFYWISEKNGSVIVAAADCTGHGVPGAFMSMLGVALLNNILAKKEELHAHEILNELRANIIESLHQSGKEGENKDGMDISLYILDFKNNLLEFSGANNPLFIIRKGALIEVKADRMPIGIHFNARESFKQQIVPLEKGDMIYSFSDGYSDQFGGPNNKKFMSANLKKLLISVYNKPMALQQDIIASTIQDWMHEMSQIDDMMIIGVRF